MAEIRAFLNSSWHWVPIRVKLTLGGDYGATRWMAQIFHISCCAETKASTIAEIYLHCREPLLDAKMVKNWVEIIKKKVQFLYVKLGKMKWKCKNHKRP